MEVNSETVNKTAGLQESETHEKLFLSPYGREVRREGADNSAKHDKVCSLLCCSLVTKRKRTAFTLAEVLITLGVIGVVAAMTIPTLVANYQKKVAATRIKQTYSQLLQAIQLSEVQNGPMKEWDIKLSDDTSVNTKLAVEKYIKPYFSNLQFCSEGKSEKCGSHVSGGGQNYFLSNGVSLAFVFFAGDYTTGYFAVVIDINGAKGPNLSGKDSFYYDTSTGSLKPYGWFDGITRENVLDGYSYTSTNAMGSTTYTLECKKEKTDEENRWEMHRHGCTALLMIDGWEMKDDYPW